MICAWNELLAILPPRFRREVDTVGKDTAQELRLRLLAPPELVSSRGSIWLSDAVTAEDLNFVVNTASRYSPWRAETAAQGYLTAPGGHRIGMCGEAVCQNGHMTGMKSMTSLCIRVARDFPGIAKKTGLGMGSILILGSPGWGKTTLLRDTARVLAETECVGVVDERGELFPMGFTRGKRMDVLTGCPKVTGINTVLRTMGADCIAVDEITEEADSLALLYAANCGVRLLATAHGASSQDFRKRRSYRPLVENRVFDTLLILRKDKSYFVERMEL